MEQIKMVLWMHTLGMEDVEEEDGNEEVQEEE